MMFVVVARWYFYIHLPSQKFPREISSKKCNYMINSQDLLKLIDFYEIIQIVYNISIKS